LVGLVFIFPDYFTSSLWVFLIGFLVELPGELLKHPRDFALAAKSRELRAALAEPSGCFGRAGRSSWHYNVHRPLGRKAMALGPRTVELELRNNEIVKKEKGR
jgi:hypothetical protein